MTDVRDPRGRKPTCLCGTCHKCKYRERRRDYAREYYHGIRRPRSRARIWTPEADRLLGTEPDDAVALTLGLTRKAVQARRYKLGIPRFSQGRHVNNDGYVVRTLEPADPLIDMCRSQRHVLEHRLVMARHLGRPLTRDETVHHKNGIKSDNRLENLELWTRGHPDGRRVEDVFAWAVEFIERYSHELERLGEEAIFPGSHERNPANRISLSRGRSG